MIFAQYKNEEAAKTFHVEFGNTPYPDPSSTAVAGTVFKPVTATYHLENAVNKAFDGTVRPEKVHIKVADPHNHYLKGVAMAFASYVRGMGYSYPNLVTENF